jgi:hypothetical protein
MDNVHKYNICTSLLLLLSHKDKVKLKFSLCHAGVWGSGWIYPRILDFRLYLEVSGQVHALAALYPREEHRIPIGCVWPRTAVDETRKRKICCYRDSNSGPSAVQPVASSYTDCAIPSLVLIQILWKLIVIMNSLLSRLWSICMCLGSVDTGECCLERGLFICLYVWTSAPLRARTVGWILFILNIQQFFLNG